MKNFISNHKKLLIGLAIALVGLGGGALAINSYNNANQEAPSNNRSYTVKLGDIEKTVSGRGFIEAGKEVKILAPVGVTVKEVLVKEGDAVGAGQALANIEPASISGKLAEAVATETDLQNQLNRNDLTSYEREALTGQRTEVRNYISQLRDLRNYPVITAPQNGVIQKVFLIDGEPIDLSNTLPSMSGSSSSGSSSSDSTSGMNVSLFTPSTRYSTENSINRDQYELRDLIPISYMAQGLITIPVYHLLFNGSLFNTQTNIVNHNNNLFLNNQTRNNSSGFMKVSDSSGKNEVPHDENSDVFSDEEAYINGRPNFIPDTTSSNVDEELLEKYLAESQSESSETPKSEGTQASPDSSSALSGNSSKSDLLAQVSDFTTYDATAFKLGSMDNLSVNIQVDERDILDINPGQEAKVSLEALPDEEFVGNISSISGSATTGEGNSKYNVIVNLNTDRNLKSGMSANVTITTGNNQNVITIPIAALQDSDKRKFVYTSENEDGTLGGEVDVTTGLSNSDYVEITSGLKEGQVIYYPKENSSLLSAISGS